MITFILAIIQYSETRTMSDFASISERKEEYLSLEVNALSGGVIAEEDIKLGDALEDGKNHIAILFYPADFTVGPREEILQLVDKKEKLDGLKCKVHISNIN